MAVYVYLMLKKHSNTIRKRVISAYDSIAEEFDQTRRAQWPECEEFLKYVKEGAKVLDLGCGNGRMYELLKLKTTDYLGIDNSLGLIKRACQNFPEARFEQGDMVKLDLPDRSFDVIFSIASFHHIPSRKLRKRAIGEMHRTLKSNGILILTVWNLFQWKYLVNFVKSIISFAVHFGLKYAWNDLWVNWGNTNVKRYYHAFLPSELVRYFSRKNWRAEEFYFTQHGDRVKFWQAFNLCLILRKNDKE